MRIFCGWMWLERLALPRFAWPGRPCHGPRCACISPNWCQPPIAPLLLTSSARSGFACVSPIGATHRLGFLHAFPLIGARHRLTLIGARHRLTIFCGSMWLERLALPRFAWPGRPCHGPRFACIFPNCCQAPISPLERLALAGFAWPGRPCNGGFLRIQDGRDQRCPRGRRSWNEVVVARSIAANNRSRSALDSAHPKQAAWRFWPWKQPLHVRNLRHW